MSFFLNNSYDFNTKIHEREVCPLLYEDNNVDIYMISDIIFGKKEINYIIDFIHSVDSKIKIKIIYPFKNIPKDKVLTRQISNYYHDNVINLKNYIPEGSKILTLGRSLYSITFNTDLNVEGFYDIVFNNSYFYDPGLKSYIFPIDTFNKWAYKNNWNNYFTFFQISNIINFKIVTRIIPELVIRNEKSLDLKKILLSHSENEKVSLDMETSGLNFMNDKIGCITLSFDGTTGYYFDWTNVKNNLLFFSNYLKSKLLIGNNLKFDLKFLSKNGIDNLKIYFDNLNAGHVINEMRSNSLKTQAWIYTCHGGYEQELENYKRSYPKCKNYLDIPRHILSVYATKDAIISFQVYEQLNKQLDEISYNEKFYDKSEKWNLKKYYFDVVVPSLNAFLCIEKEGVYINWDNVKRAEFQIEKEISNIKNNLKKSFNCSDDINWDSNEQIAKILENKNWENYGVSKKGLYLVNEDTIDKWIKNNHREAILLKKLHELNTLMSTFIGRESESTGYWQYKQIDNKVYPNYGVMLTDSLRNFSKNPNFQNIVKHGDYAKLIRSYFCPPSEDYIILSFDFSGFQLRIGCIYSGDKAMTKVFKELGGDLHSMSASNILLNNKISIEEFISRKDEKEFDNLRFKAKGINFSLEFNTTAISFAEESLLPNWDVAEINKYLRDNNIISKPYTLFQSDISKDRQLTMEFCKYWAVAIDIKNKFFNTYPELKKWIDSFIKFAENNGYIKSKFGAIRRTPQLLYRQKESDERERVIKQYQNIAVNSPVQNYEVTISNLSIIQMSEWLSLNNKKTRIFGMTHDSIDFYCYKFELYDIINKFKEIAEKDLEENNGIPIKVDCNVAYYYEKNQVWGFGDKIKV